MICKLRLSTRVKAITSGSHRANIWSLKSLLREQKLGSWKLAKDLHPAAGEEQARIAISHHSKRMGLGAHFTEPIISFLQDG